MWVSRCGFRRGFEQSFESTSASSLIAALSPGARSHPKSARPVSESNQLALTHPPGPTPRMAAVLAPSPASP